MTRYTSATDADRSEMLATIGVGITAAITGIAAYFILGVPFTVALLLGAALASTDPATLVPIFQ